MENNMIQKETEVAEVVEESTEPIAEKMFTQEQVNEIIRKRLRNQKENNATAEQLSIREADLVSRESRLSCKEYLMEKGYPAELLDVLDTSDVELFKNKADKASNMFGVRNSVYVAPLASTEPSMCGNGDPVSKAFAERKKHIPKAFPPR